MGDNIQAGDVQESSGALATRHTGLVLVDADNSIAGTCKGHVGERETSFARGVRMCGKETQPEHNLPDMVGTDAS